MNSHQQLAAALVNPQSFATTLLVVAADAYGTEMFEWAPETLYQELCEDFNVQLPRVNFDRLMAAVAIITTDDFYRSLPDFIHLCNVLAGDTYDPENWDPADATEVAWGITEGLLIDPPDENDDNPFSEEICRYIGKVLDDEGIITPPGVLQIAKRDPSHKVIGDEYSDDPIMFDAIYDLETAKSTQIDTIVNENTRLLIQQLRGLPLNNGDTTDLIKKLEQWFKN